MFAQQLEKDFDSEPLSNETKTAAILVMRGIKDGSVKIENVNLGPEWTQFAYSVRWPEYPRIGCCIC